MPATTTPRVVAQTVADDQATLELHIPADLLYFQGHFPGAPIVPGVILTDWAIRFAQSLLGTPAAIRELKAIKFHHVIRPDDHVSLTLDARHPDRTTAFRYASAEQTHASGRIVWASPDSE